LLRFLHSIRVRKQTAMSLETSISQGEIMLFQIQPATDGNPLRLARQELPETGIEADFLEVQAIAEPTRDQKLKVTIFCDGREFSQLEYGAELFAAVAHDILEQRHDADNYPCYITDLDLSAVDPTGSMQTVQYLRYRQQLEDALNAQVTAQALTRT